MGIQIETTVYGAQLGRELSCNPEELAYALEELIECDAARLGREVADLGPYGKSAEIAAWLRGFANAIAPEETLP